MKTLFLTAIDREIRAIRPAFAGHGAKIQDGGPIGIRATRLNAVLADGEVSTVVLCGVAGALNPRLKVGDVILDDPFNRTPNHISLSRGTIYTSDEIISTPMQKAGLYASTGADAVDMEHAVVRDWCTARGLRLMGVRAISDTATETLDPAVLALVNDLGHPRPAKIIAGIARDPAMIPHLLRLNANTKIALDRLRDAIRLIVEAL